MIGRKRVSAVALGATVLAACTGGDAASPVTTAPAVTTTTIVQERTSDGRLTLGVLLPTAETSLREPLESAVNEAVDRINDAGGVLDRPVSVVFEDEGGTAATASAAVDALLSSNVDAIIGPSSSSAALSTLAAITAAEVLSCSPTASALALDDFPDEELFFRTIPSDSLQAEAIAEYAAESGFSTAAIVHVDDAYGRPFAEAVEASLASRAISVTDSISFDSNQEPRAAAEALARSDARVAILLANGADGVSFLAALDTLPVGTSLNTIVANDALRDPAGAQRIAALAPELRESIVGIAPEAVPANSGSPYDPPGPYAANAFDCVNLIALSAERVQSDNPREMAGQMAAVSSSGSDCRTFAECADALRAGLRIDYDGPSGVTDLSVARGDPSRARFDVFAFDNAGRDAVIGTLIAAR
ncbi:MAG: ABC transporter substrate-binding protein [Actinomycetota bacterium]